VALANVGIFYAPKEPPLVPDAMLSLDVTQEPEVSKKENNTYFVWTRGKVPDVVIEIVSDRKGGEETHKMRQYAKWGIPYYVIFDPDERLRHGVLRVFGIVRKKYEPTEAAWLEDIGLGLTLWEGVYRDLKARWLRWCDSQGRPIPTGEERADKAAEQARRERARRQKLEAQLRKLGVELET
jgi:Uma2 family endonuclease